MLFRLVTIIYFTLLCDSLTHPHIFVFDKKFDQHSSARVFGQSAPVPPPPPAHACMAIHEVDFRYQETTEKTLWTIHEVVITVTEYDKYLICESNFSPCQNDGFAAKTLIRAKAIPQGTQATFSTQF